MLELKSKTMIVSIFNFLFFLVIAVILIEVVFWLLGIIVPTFVISSRIRALLYTLLIIVIILWALNGFSGVRLFH